MGGSPGCTTAVLPIKTTADAQELLPYEGCPFTYNSDQADSDSDGIGDVCCCNHDGIRGDVNGSDAINSGELTYLVDFLFFDGPFFPLCGSTAI